MIDPSLKIDRVTLAVGDLDRSTDFYRRALGMQVVEEQAGRALLGPAGALELHGIEDPRPTERTASGLYHVAWLHPTRAALAYSLRRLVKEGWRLDGASDHGVSEALYLSDPDGLGIELYADRPREFWPQAPDGSVAMFTAPLDLASLLDAGEGEPAPEIDPATVIGHVHLKVADVERSLAFYRDALGFEERAALPGAAFVAAGGYHHHVGLNAWESRGAPRAAQDTPGLRNVAFSFATADALAPLLAAGDAHGTQQVDVTGPDGEHLTFTA
ncbi:MAG TPA: VOC family protein [Solirubrobacteraceae bacterium]|nr:VOC family protein [Solirubrobacteraceae bacterium]